MKEISFERLVTYLSLVQFLSVVKVLVLFCLLLYLVFAVVIIKQVNLMRRSLNGILEWPLPVLAWIHFGFALSVFLLAAVIL